MLQGDCIAGHCDVGAKYNSKGADLSRIEVDTKLDLHMGLMDHQIWSPDVATGWGSLAHHNQTVILRRSRSLAQSHAKNVQTSKTP